MRIIRICRFKIFAGRLPQGYDCIRRLRIPITQSARGAVAVYACAPPDPKSREVVLVTVWEDAESLREHTGLDLSRVCLAEEERWLIEDARAEVFEELEAPIS
jgi:quinol monooxygenase YgiN